MLCRAATVGAGVGGRGGVHWHGRRRPWALALAWEAAADAGGGDSGGRWRGRRWHARGSRESWLDWVSFAWSTNPVPKGYDSARAYGEKI